MKITGDVYNVSKIYDSKKPVGKIEKTSSVAPKKDVISISSNAMDYQTVTKALKEVPDVRQNKVDEFAQAYRSGSYDVSGREIVEKLGKSIIDQKA
ncbi:flagellar biosynthesis anti-sigma factor FlgM [Ruminiclostridium cellobioparum]|uniref:Anti-sigma-28 factor, FlgM n=1 Tax=Ruminiclostridium cellobioparum subsp. termitidis CT1112 TaxID=1195236 RepID=S0FVC2_RUMCE|nr:flagellar biosynthesis anti-sigma factor FlgM [Ruminiclostridium cellobioparum]EMS72478.1 Anti-sigma-28 factor, FlgM [Ruminiclostridium cellobioparum subsp. termitidis CT1112]